MMNYIIEALIGVVLLTVGLAVMTSVENVLLYVGGGVSTFFGFVMLGSAILDEARDRTPAVLIKRQRFGRSRAG